MLGHEIVGEIEMIESSHGHQDYQGRQLNIGDIITWTIFASDPLSSNALDGMPQKGDNLFKYGHGLVDGNDAFHGELGEYCFIKRGSCILKIPAALPLSIAATINCAIATSAGAIRLAGSLKNKNIVIFGMGTPGVTCAVMCKDAGAAWVGAADIENKRIQDALLFGAVESVNIKDEQKIPGKFNSNFFTKHIDVVFDMSGSADAMENGLSMLAVEGVAVWVGAVFLFPIPQGLIDANLTKEMPQNPGYN
ncbi:MAG TPA: zinc-binding dehydrogenase [Agriterribacter sp.]|nr:zinc-binding dehydrogenase [Agriterribacter sp.]